MSIHEQLHGILDTDDHGPGATAAAGETNLIGTSDGGVLVELTQHECNLQKQLHYLKLLMVIH